MRALTDAPAFSNIWTMSSWPLRHAMCKAVRPSYNATFTTYFWRLFNWRQFSPELIHDSKLLWIAGPEVLQAVHSSCRALISLKSQHHLAEQKMLKTFLCFFVVLKHFYVFFCDHYCPHSMIATLCFDHLNHIDAINDLIKWVIIVDKRNTNASNSLHGIVQIP